jgi:hypothetical protein
LTIELCLLQDPQNAEYLMSTSRHGWALLQLLQSRSDQELLSAMLGND